jgi:hypothetical protein
MNKFKLSSFTAMVISLVIFLITSSPLVQAEEIGYDQLVQELTAASQKKSIAQTEQIENPFTQSRVHASFGFIDAIQTISVDNYETSRFSEGVAFGLGVDVIPGLFIAEGTFENYGKTQTGPSELQLKQFALRGIYEKPVNSKVTARVINGLAVRTVKFSDELKNIDSKKSAPNYMLGVGFNTWINPSLEVGAEFTGQTALISEPIIKSALNVGLKLNAIF